MNGLADKIRLTVDSEFPGAQPSPFLWQRIAPTLPAPAAGRHLTAARYLPGAVAALLILSLTGVGLASTPQGRSAIDWAMGRFGIRLVVNTPALQADLISHGAEVTEGVEVPWQGAEKLQAKLPTGMRLPGYLPKGFEAPVVNLNTWTAGAAVSFLATRTNQTVSVQYHSSAFPSGSMTATTGEARDVQEVKVGGRTGLAYRDDAGWTVMWPLYGHQYQVETNISLAEALKIAESIK